MAEIEKLLPVPDSRLPTEDGGLGTLQSLLPYPLEYHRDQHGESPTYTKLSLTSNHTSFILLKHFHNVTVIQGHPGHHPEKTGSPDVRGVLESPRVLLHGFHLLPPILRLQNTYDEELEEANAFTCTELKSPLQIKQIYQEIFYSLIYTQYSPNL